MFQQASPDGIIIIMAKNIALLLLVILSIFLAGELVMNVYDLAINRSGIKSFSGEKDFRGWRFDETLNRVHIPGLKFEYVSEEKKEFRNLVEYNSKGLNDYEYGYAKPAGCRRILVFGDSFVEALQVKKEENFCKLLEKELNSWETFKKYEVINMGVSGYSPILEYIYLKREGLKYSPDIVITCFFMNDVFEDSAYKNLAVFDSEGLPVAVTSRGFDKTAKLKGWKRIERKISSTLKEFLNKSKFYTFLKGRIYRILTMAKFKKMDKGQNQFFIVTDERAPDEPQMWGNTFRYLKAMKKISEENNARFMMVVIPLESQVSDDFVNASFKAYFDKKPDSSRSNGLITAFCNDEGMECVNLVNEFNEKNSEGLYFKNDGHFTAKGHEETAKIIGQKLKTLDWAE